MVDEDNNEKPVINPHSSPALENDLAKPMQQKSENDASQSFNKCKLKVSGSADEAVMCTNTSKSEVVVFSAGARLREEVKARSYLPIAHHQQGSTHLRILIDSGSTSSFCTVGLISTIKHKVIESDVPLAVNTLNRSRTILSKKVYHLHSRTLDNVILNLD